MRAEALLEMLEPRLYLSVTITVDYSLDTLGFFDVPARREVVEAAADYVGSLLNDSLTAIIPGAGNSWRLVFNHPATGEPTEVVNPVIDRDELLIFVGGRDLPGTTLGLGGAGGWQATGSQSFLLAIEGRGQSGATGPADQQTDVALWGGTIVFDSATNWHTGLTTVGLAPGMHDLYSVALHEMLHVLGFTDQTPAFANLISPSGEFMGPRALAVADGGETTLLPGDFAHWREGLTSRGQETAMDPTFATGQRKLLTPLDLAAMEDIGWELEPLRWPGRGSTLALSPFSGSGVGSGTATASLPGLHTVTPRQDGLLDFRVEAAQPVTLRVWDSRGLLVASVDQPDTITGLGLAVDTQFHTIEIITAGSPASYLLSVTSGGLDTVAYAPEGFASPEIDQTVWITNTTGTGQLFTLELRYERVDLGRDADAVAFERVIEPGQRLPLHIARQGVFATDQATGRSILVGEPYALVLHSTAPLSAALEHADTFNGQRITTAEDFTRTTNSTWHFARAEKASNVFGFVVFANANGHDALVTVTFTTSIGSLEITQVVRARARGGLNLQQIETLPDGAYGVIVRSEALMPADQPGHVGIVAGFTHFDGVLGLGWTVLGQPGNLPVSNIAPLANLPGAANDVLVFNAGSSVARIRFVRTSEMGSETLEDRFVPVGVASRFILPEAFGYRYEFITGIGAVQFVQRTDTDATSGSLPTAASRRLAFSLGDFDPTDADSLLRLSLFNTAMVQANVTVRFLFLTGIEVVQTLQVGAQGFGSLAVDAIEAVRGRASDGPLGVVLESTTPLTGLLAAFERDNAYASGGMALPA